MNEQMDQLTGWMDVRMDGSFLEGATEKQICLPGGWENFGKPWHVLGRTKARTCTY